MRLYILASGKDAKGTQLEYLTKSILDSLGYQYVATNYITAGGDEIDVYAKVRIPTPGKMMEYPVLCECKAHESPISENDWQKFLGKMFKQRQKNSLTQGLMIALSDANGNVKGDYDQSHYEGIQLLQGNDLIQSLSKAFSLESEPIAREQVLHLTNETVISVDMVLFEKEIYWLFTFASGQFSLFDKNYHSLSEGVSDRLIPLLSKYTTLKPSSYKDIRKEFELVQRRDLVHTVLCWRMMRGTLHFQDAVSDVVHLTNGTVIPDIKDVEEVAATLPFAGIDSQLKTVSLKAPEEIDYLVFYREALRGPIPAFLFSDYYLQHIDYRLLDRIFEIQFGLTLEEKDREKCLFLLRHSPGALRYALYPDRFVKSMVVMDEHTDNHSARNHFVEQLISFFIDDLKGDGSSFVFSKLGLRDFKKEIAVNVTDKTGEEQSISTSQRLFSIQHDDGSTVIVQAVDSFKGKYDPITDRVIDQSNNKQTP